MVDEGDEGEVMDRGGRRGARDIITSSRPECLLVISWCGNVGERGERSSCEKRLCDDGYIVLDSLLGGPSGRRWSVDDLRLR